MKILIIVPYPTEGPSNRYRVEQYLPYLKEKGIDYSVRPFVSSDFFKILYRRGSGTKKILYFLYSTAKRLYDLINSINYDLILIHIESFPFGPAVLEWFFSKLGKPIIYDFEDAVYLPNFKGNNRILNLLRYPDKFFQILSLSSHVIVCNKHMKEFISLHNASVTVIPTSIDTDKFKLKDFKITNPKTVIGWIGSHTTLYCLDSLRKVFIDLAKESDFLLKVIGGGQDFKIPGVNVVNEEWRLEKDVRSFQELDIGIYPLPADERALAKTPFKAIQYMSVGVPVVASRVGGNTEIIQDGQNGFLVSSDKEWIEKLSLLIRNPRLREQIGLAGRKNVEERYSVKVNAPRFIKALKETYGDNC